jgi:hypothetical protein
MGSNENGDTEPRHPSQQDFVIIKSPDSKWPASSPNHVLKTIVHPSGERRVQIIRRFDGLFTYDEEELVMAYDPELAEALSDFRTCWVPAKLDVSIFESQEAAESAARGAVTWLAEI